MQFDIKDTKPVSSTRRKALWAACVAHVLHDGYTDQLYALLPVWQSEFGLSYAGLAMVRALYYGTMGGLQVPGDRLIARLSPRMALTLATFVAAAGYLVMALPFGFPSLCIGLIIAGIGSSVQHPRASLLVTNTYGKASRSSEFPLGTQNPSARRATQSISIREPALRALHDTPDPTNDWQKGSVKRRDPQADFEH
jgi:FSR family fosmidomycin resistance protein-like MFS transporter